MSATDALLVLLDKEAGFDGWLRLEEGVETARGRGVEGIPMLEDGGTVVAVVPGEEVSVHWIELPPGLAPAQAVAAARLMAAGVSAQPIEEMHVAVGREVEEEGLRCIALAPALAMTEWLGRLQAHGLDPDIILPEPLLLEAPDDGIVRYGSIYRGRTEAFAMEPHLAEIALAGRAETEIDKQEFETGLAGALAVLPVNLRQGAFGKRSQWKIDPQRVRRLVLLGLAILLVTMAIQIASILRYSGAAALEEETARVVTRTMPGGDGPEDLDRRLGELRGGGIGYSALASALFAAVQGTANAELTALVIEPDGSLRATVQADTPATIAALAGRLEGSGLGVVTSGERSGGGRQLADLTVRPR